ncbi:GtrA family protein [Sphingobium estronivorans]|uniref:GtrA family protein n=1 Tax=Sphingobium estronivorans TaxID=1577690 RepID=UPI0019674E86|nr:GtrA family protein [Sphingobium estronivorans]
MPLLARLRPLIARFMFARYMLVSLCALCTDMALFLALSHAGLPPAPAAFCGYVGGLALHWMLSIRFVFATQGGVTHAQRLAFIVSALLGLGITVTMVTALCAVGMTPAAAKLFSVPLSFLSVYAIRKYGIFARA